MIYKRKTLDGKLYAYDSETSGVYKWWPRQRKWKETGLALTQGYHNMGFKACTSVHVHRVIWWIVTGKMPTQIDHVNGDRSDNRLCNLREVTSHENSKNQKRHSTNTSGCTGVHWTSQNKSWRVIICVNGKNKHLGYFTSFDEARQVRLDAERRYGYHPNHGLTKEDRAKQPPDDSHELAVMGLDNVPSTSSTNKSIN